MKLSVIGNGIMGKGIIETILNQKSALKVESILWLARDLDKSNSYLKILSRQLKKAERRLDDSNYSSQEIISKLVISDDFTKLFDCEIIIEAVSENMDVKKITLDRINEYRNENSIVASNTSSYSITELATRLTNPEKFIGLHFFNPAPIMTLIEIVKGLTTDNDVIERMLEFSRFINKEPVVVNEAPGFIVNRMLIPMINEAVAIYAEGIAEMTEIDKAMKLGANHPIGPFALSDLIGNDVVLSILNTLYTETGDAKYRPHTLLKKYVRANRLGRKTRAGFYKY